MRHGFSFGIRHLLVISVWISLLLTAIRLSGLDFVFVLSLLVGWSVYQAATLWIGGLLVSAVLAAGGLGVKLVPRETTVSADPSLCVSRGTHKTRIGASRLNPRSRFT